MKITDALLGEHGVFYAQFARLDEAVPTASGATELREMAALPASGLASHAAIEDELLFDRLEQVLGADSGPLPVMRAEHSSIEAALAAAATAPEADRARRCITEAVELAREHFAKEERVLFPLAEQMIPEESLVELGHAWAVRRHVTLTPAVRTG